MAVQDLRRRFDRLVDRAGEHHRWMGATRPDTGVGRIKVGGRHRAAHEVAWELAYGAIPVGGRVAPCAEVRACVRPEHLRLVGRDRQVWTGVRARSRRSPRGAGSKRQVGENRWELCVTLGRYDDDAVRRQYRRVWANDADDASRQLAAFVAELHAHGLVDVRAERDITLDDAVDRYLAEHLIGEKGRSEDTAADYRALHRRWFAAALGKTALRNIDEAALDKAFGAMQRAGLSKSRMNQARSLYAPLFRWACHRRLIVRNPMVAFSLPTSRHVAQERIPPEASQLAELLAIAVDVVPEIAPILALGAVTGMRRGELVGVRRSKIDWTTGRLTVDTAIAATGRVKTTKTRTERSFFVDDETMAMLHRHCAAMDERATAVGCGIAPDAFLFSLAADCSTPMSADYLTKRVAVLKERLGVSSKRADTVRLEDEALKLYREPRAPRPSGKTGPAPRGGMSFREIGERLGRSERWAVSAVRAASERENAIQRQPGDLFDASVVALRKFTSSELLDAGFNVSMVAARQGHGPQVLVKHYAKSRRSADRRAADHLGAVVHGPRHLSHVEEPFERSGGDDDATAETDAGKLTGADERVSESA